MIDRENVIKRINALMDEARDDEFLVLPVFDTLEVLKDARELLKMQEPVEPYAKTSKSGTSWWYSCGNCNRAIDPNYKYCRNCGRAVKWDD